MTLNNSHTNALPQWASEHVSERLNRVQADVMATARIWALDEVSAKLAHRFNEPLTALLLYLQGIKDQNPCTGAHPNLTSKIAAHALCEAERVRDIVEQIGDSLAFMNNEPALLSFGDAFHRTHNACAHSAIHLLTAREREVLVLIVKGVSNKEGGYQLAISTRTFEVHRANVMQKFGAKNAADLVRIAMT